MLIDNHIHTGWFKGHYYSAQYVWNEIQSTGIDRVAISSLSSVSQGFHKIAIREIKEMQRLGKDRIIPLLWVCPNMFKPKGEYVLRELLHSGIDWQGIKIHYYMHPEWQRNKALASKAFALARQMQLPILAHTGGSLESDAGVFLEIARANSDVTIILAHGRPIEEAVEVLQNCPNTMVDTAFMPMEDQKKLVDTGFASRLLFGTDIPINKFYYPQMPTSEFVQKHLDELRSVTTEEQYLQIINNTPFKK